MFARSIRSMTLVLGLSLTALSSGCVFGPGNGAHVGTRSDSIRFEGFTNRGGQTVTLWAKKNDGSWQYITNAQTQSTGYNYFGLKWHYWYKSEKLPTNCWKWAGGTYVAEIKAVGFDPHSELPAFNEGFWDYFSAYDNVSDLYQAEGSGTIMTIYANP